MSKYEKEILENQELVEIRTWKGEQYDQYLFRHYNDAILNYILLELKT